MSGFIQLLSSGANAILTLEGQNTTCADVFYVWVCIAYHLEQVLASPDVGLTHLRDNVIGIYNHRFNQMMEESSLVRSVHKGQIGIHNRAYISRGTYVAIDVRE